jgi:homoaconitase
MSPVAATPTADANAAAFDSNAAQAWIAYYAQNPDQDPYATMGGYGAYLAMWQQSQAQQQPGYAQYYAGQSSAPGTPANPAAASYGAPPPPAEPASAYGAPPPPPPAASPHNYGSVPPPPGM